MNKTLYYISQGKVHYFSGISVKLQEGKLWNMLDYQEIKLISFDWNNTKLPKLSKLVELIKSIK